MFKKHLAIAVLLLLAAGTVFAGEKLLTPEKFEGKTTFTFKGDLKDEWYESLKAGSAAFMIIKTETNLVESVLADMVKSSIGYEEKGKQKLQVKTKGKMKWSIKSIPTSEYLEGAVGTSEGNNYVDFQIREISVKLKGTMSMVKALTEAVNSGSKVFQNYEIMPEPKGKKLKYSHKDDKQKIKMTVSEKTKQYTLAWTLNEECVIPKFTSVSSEK